MTDKNRNVHNIGSGRRYIIGDAVEELRNIESPADLICLDDAWARPQRANQFGVMYPTHRFSESESQRASDESTTTIEILDACWEALTEGGWLIADADDWLLPRLIEYLVREWGDVVEDYKGGGYRRIGGVTYIAKSTKRPDRSTAGEYFTNGGYPVVFAHKGSTDRKSSTSARQIAHRQHDKFGWGSVKPIKPYKKWIEGLLTEGDHLVVPCAGTAPAAIAAERVFGTAARYTCIDIEKEAFEAFQIRRQEQLDSIQENIKPKF
ncbi:hypothetical protein NGM10_01985 [Halorussus salilacus]|uniref:hypothetical protein n=1 Tax=Halorussus salilacus TaxID=2953750 RepID=UPI0020A02AC8|nr:hypothetical protein [Halorussus salilacus]USZ68522.1 hypothetical protein NGM10_01985 [Halorussus salilacus]